MTKNEILSRLRKELPLLNKQYHVNAVGLFGSYVKGNPDSNSDVDLIVKFDRPIGLGYVELAEHLEAILGRKVDLITPAGLDSIRIKGISENIKSRIVYV